MSCRRPGPRGGLAPRPDLVEVLAQPGAELARLARRVEQECGSALHVVVDHGRGDAAGLVQQAHAAVVAGHQRSLGGGHRHVELALGVLAVDQQRPRQPDRNLGDSDEMLDVAGGERRIERIIGYVLKRDTGPFTHEVGPVAGGGAGVVVLPVARNRDATVGANGFHHTPPITFEAGQAGVAPATLDTLATISSTICGHSAGGMSCPIPGTITSRAPGIAAAVARPPDGITSRSSSPWITVVGTRSSRSNGVRSWATTIAPSWRSEPAGWMPRSKQRSARRRKRSGSGG